MNEKQKTRPVAGTTEREVAEMTACRASIPISNYNTTAADRQLKISDILGTGVANALTMQELRQFVNADSRTIRLQIEAERRSGIPILSGQDGYWLAASPAEAQLFARSMLHRSQEIARTARAVERAARLL
ncbi:MAG: hypothetical protein ACI3W5_00355 [Faecousia sp.]